MHRLGLPPPPWIVGHRGAAGEALENTVESLDLALEQGADMLEADLQLSRDGELVAFHDWDLQRLAGRAEVIERRTLGELASVELAARVQRRRQTGRIPTLDEILAAVPAAMPLNLELKRRLAARARFARALAGVVARRRRVLFSSFDWKLLAEVRRLLPRHPVAPLGDRQAEPLMTAAENLRAFSIHCHRRLACRHLVAAAQRSGRPLLVYTVNGAASARRLLELGVSGIFTDHPGRLRGEIDR